MGVLIDTNAFIEVERGSARSLDEVVGEEECGLSVITVSELLHGIHRARGAVRARRRAWVEALLESAEAVPITASVARVHAELWASLVGHGKVIGQHDLWVGATALTHGLGIVTRNPRDFVRVPGLRVVPV